MYRQAVVEEHASARHGDVDRISTGERGMREQRLRLPEEDVDEAPQPELVRAGHEPHRPVLLGDVVEGSPGRDRVRLEDRPVRLILMRVGLATTRLLVERLV